MFNLFVFSVGALVVVKYVFGNDKENIEKENNYPSGYELKRELRDIAIYSIDKALINIDLIEEYIFRDYVYTYEKLGRLY